MEKRSKQLPLLFTSSDWNFDDLSRAYDAIRDAFPALDVVEVPSHAVTLQEAIRTYLFNAQLLTLPTGEMALVIPLEAWEHPRVRAWLDGMLASNGRLNNCVRVSR